MAAGSSNKKSNRLSAMFNQQAAIRWWSNFASSKLPKTFDGIKKEIKQSGLPIIFETYVGRMLHFASIATILTFIYSLIITSFLGFPLIFVLSISILLALAAGGVIIGIFYTYPYQLIVSKRKSIESNLPFASNHMSAIISSGVPPNAMFEMLTDVEEYGEVAKEAKKIVRNIKVFGMDTASAIRQVAERTPSQEFKEFLMGIVATLSSGGDLRKYIQYSSKETLADYKIKRERYLSTLSTYADFYVGILIAAPLFFISILSLMAIIGGQISGFSIPVLMGLGIYLIIPLLNIFFIHFTKPSL